MTHQITLCGSCRGQPGLSPSVFAALSDHYAISETECMSGCNRPQTVAFRAPGKTAYLFGDIGQADIPDLARFADLYHASTDGTFADARILGGLRMKAIARIPG